VLPKWSRLLEPLSRTIIELLTKVVRTTRDWLVGADVGNPKHVGVLCPIGDSAEHKLVNFLLDGRHLRVELAGVHNATRRLCDFNLNGRNYVIVELDATKDVRPLSRREREVAFLIAKGRSTKQIAYDLGISYHTTDEYVSRILLKLGARNRPEMVALLFGGE
jgi:DNA-binding CsgD family transcriptional regulator